jgi:hypothetical protein
MGKLMPSSVNTAPTFLQKDPALKKLFQVDIPELAASNPYLMHGMLTASALHLAHTQIEQRQSWKALAFSHYKQALAGVRPELSNLTESNSQPVFTLLVMISTVSMSTSRFLHLDKAEPSFSVPDIIEPIVHVRGVSKVGQVAFNWLNARPAQTLRDVVPNWDSKTQQSLIVEELRPTPLIASQFKAVRDLVGSSHAPFSRLSCIFEAVNTLQSIYLEVAKELEDVGRLHPGTVWK